MEDDLHHRLREDVKLLGQLLGEVLRAHEGDALFNLVERVRLLAKGAREGHPQDAEALRSLLGGLQPQQALPLARAFSHFLALANIAEQHHRVRCRRAKAETSLKSGLTALFDRFQTAGIPPEHIAKTVSNMNVDLVFTAHPTQAIRRTLIQKYRRVARGLEKRDRPGLTAIDEDEITERLRREITAIWYTDELRREWPTPIDEVRAGMVLFEQILWDALPRFWRTLDRNLVRVTGRSLPLDATPITFGSWMGGDRDGNPNVTARVTEEALLLARWMTAELYHRELTALHDELSMTRASDELCAHVPGAHEPYRAMIKPLLARMVATRRWCEKQLAVLRAEGGHTMQDESDEIAIPSQPESPSGLEPYFDPSEMKDTLLACHRSLVVSGAAVIAEGRLLDLIRRVCALGLTLTRLDVRQEASVHTHVLDVITRELDLGNYSEWDEDQRQKFLVHELASKRPLLPRQLPDDPVVKETLDTMKVCARQPPGSLGAYIISMASRPSDVLAVHLLQRECGVDPPMRVVPLFETLADLQRSGQVIAALLAIPWYHKTVQGKQEVMIGYSDSTKDAGRLSAAWALYRAQEDLIEICRRHNVDLTLFHGRGGTIGRGGGPIYLAILSQPPGSVEGRLRVTVQGETIEVSFGLPGIADEGLELYTGAVLEATLAPPIEPQQSWRDEMDRLSTGAAAAYRAVIRGEPRFLEYFYSGTPERELGWLKLGSRPPRRRQDPSLQSLRAIPWVFAWTQTRLILPSWLGTGEALEEAFASGRGPIVQEMAQKWPFFRALLDLFEMVLGKADPDITAYYDSVLVSSELRPFGELLRQRYHQTVRGILQAKQEDRLMVTNPDLQRGVELRNPYVDPLNLLQAELLHRLRETDDDHLVDPLLITINGIAAGMRNTG